MSSLELEGKLSFRLHPSSFMGTQKLHVRPVRQEEGEDGRSAGRFWDLEDPVPFIFGDAPLSTKNPR